ncbi:MAG TPA: BlaI/MecI/CopY family transcriptional regulator [Bryobacteraceae bacterium]|nr:BlaI/MecI/CopY family transcriptional regulator [Bryobacteraceae bacterium]
MPRKKSPQLTEAELRLMNVLWEKGQATVGEVAEALTGNPPLAYSSVLTILRILEGKGYLRHTKEGRAFLYEPAINREEASTGAIRQLLARFFNNSPELLVANLLSDEALSRKEIDRLKKLIAQHE